MAYQFCDVFANLTSTTGTPWETTFGTITYGSAYTRFAAPTNCLGGGVSLAANAYMRKNLQSSQSTFVVFMSYGIPTLSSNQYSSVVFTLLDSGTYQVYLGVTSTGALQFFVNNNSAPGLAVGPSSAAALIAPSTKPIYGIEAVVTISATVGVVQCWLNGTQVINASNLNTKFTANASANQLQIGGQSGNIGNSDMGLYTDYVRVWDSTGSTQNAATGTDRRVITKIPTGAGTLTNWTPVGLASNWQCVSQVPPNVADYVSTGTAGTLDSYALPVAGLLSAPSMVVARSYMEKDDANTRTYANGVLSGGSQSLGSAVTAASGFAWVDSCIPNDPATAAPWTAAGADAAQFLHEEIT